MLVEQEGWKKTSEDVLGQMLDPGNQWQNEDGGWAHTSPLPSQSDLYSTLYAVQLLHCAEASGLGGTEVATRRLECSLNYLSACWDREGWALEGLTSEEVFPQAFIEVVDILRVRRPDLYDLLVLKLLLQLNPAGGLSEKFRGSVSDEVSDERHLARLAYATYRALQSPSIWRRPAEAAMAGGIDELNSVEAAFLIDLALSESGNPAPPA
jgi:hypothetical protein